MARRRPRDTTPDTSQDPARLELEHLTWQDFYDPAERIDPDRLYGSEAEKTEQAAMYRSLNARRRLEDHVAAITPDRGRRWRRDRLRRSTAPPDGNATVEHRR